MRALLLAFLLTAPAQEPAAEPDAGGDGAADAVARWDGGQLSAERFDRFLGSHLKRQPSGQEALRHLLQLRLVRIEAEERGITVSEEAVDARIAEAEAALASQDMELDQVLASRSMPRAEFRRLIRDSLLHEALVRDDLDLEPGTPVPAAQLQEWTDARVAELLEESAAAPPGMALDAPPHRVSELELGRTIRRSLGNPRLQEYVEQLVLQEALPQWAARERVKLRDEILWREIAWRRRHVREHPLQYGGARYEDLLGAQGATVESVLQGEEIRVAGYLWLMARRAWPDAWFEELSGEERHALLAEHGAARRVSWLLLRAVDEKSDPLDRSFAEAAEELHGLRDRLEDPGGFGALARDYSEHETTRRIAGRIGWVHREESGVPQDVCDAAFAAGVGQVHGPVEVRSASLTEPLQGQALILVHEARPAPTPEEFRARVRRSRHQELRQRFLDEIGLVTVFAEDGGTR